MFEKVLSLYITFKCNRNGL